MTWGYPPVTEGVAVVVTPSQQCSCRPGSSLTGAYLTVCATCGGTYMLAPTSAALTQGGPRGCN